ncbi:DNA gyrase subunit A, partial [Staphylococcus hominis]|uniref:DNA gyrase subunit A n=1 Tax=Staphylococcus hominis TaxID=1290 RepID=UPI0037099C9C
MFIPHSLPQSTINQTNITNQIPQSFLHYPISLILSPPLPHLPHPLKPLHPPILYPLNQQPITPHKPYKKSPPILRHVIPKYHPHTHSSIYHAILTIPQTFTYPYPLLHPQPNFPSIHPHPPPPIRYTQPKITKITLQLLRHINKHTIHFLHNYD